MIAIDVLAGRELALHHLANLRASLIRAADQAGSGRSPVGDQGQPDRSPTAE
jgi:hypothetical protein